MGQAPSLHRHRARNLFNHRLPPSPSTYAKFLATQTLSHLPPDSGPQFSHAHHHHFGPDEGIFDCVQRSSRTEDRIGHCFKVLPERADVIDLKDTFVADGNQANEVLRIGTRDRSERMLVGEEPLIVTRGDIFTILFCIGFFIIAYGVAWGADVVWEFGVRSRADASAKRDLEARASCMKTARSQNFLLHQRRRSSSLVRERRYGFCDILDEEIKKELIRESMERAQRVVEELKEVFEDGEYRARSFSNSAASDDDHDEDQNWSEVSLETRPSWASDFNGDLIRLGT